MLTDALWRVLVGNFGVWAGGVPGCRVGCAPGSTAPVGVVLLAGMRRCSSAGVREGLEPVQGMRDHVGPGQCPAKRRMRRRPVVTSWAAVENSRNRRRRDSQSRAWPVRGIQASRSRAICTVSSQIWFCAVSWRGRLRRPAARMQSSARARCRCRSSRAAIASPVVLVAKRVSRVGVSETQLGAGVWPFLAHDQP